jgi:Tfp pilus assembly protein PilN
MSDPNQLSFLPDDYLANKAQRRTNAICGMLFLVVLLALAAAFALTERPLAASRRANALVAAQYADAARPIEQFHQMQEKQRQVTAQAQLSASLLEKVPRSFLLAEITNALPAGTSLLEVSLDSKARPQGSPGAGGAAPKTQYELKKAALEAKTSGVAAGPPLAEPKILDVTLRVTGMTNTDVQVAQFMSGLSRSKLLTDVNLVVSDEYEHDKHMVRKFQIEMQVNPDAEVEHAEQGPADATAPRRS